MYREADEIRHPFADDLFDNVRAASLVRSAWTRFELSIVCRLVSCPVSMSTTRCDLHVHSSASVGSDEWYTRVFGCPESYADPVLQYELCKARGMSLVTLTDHDRIDGALALVDRPDFFISEEVTAVFPENGCVMHVLAWNITRTQHEGIQSVRQNIYQLCDYLHREGIAHGLAHPLLSPNWRLDVDTFEKTLLLFPALEGINGLLDRRIESDLFTVLDRLTPELIASLAQRHGIPARGAAPWRKALVAGSDDHVHRRCGSVYTEIDGSLPAGHFLDRCMGGQARLVGRQAHLDTMAACIKHTAYHYLKQRHAEGSGSRNPLVDMLDLLAGREPDGPHEAAAGGWSEFLTTLGARVAGAEICPGKPFDILETPEQTSEHDDARIVEGMAELSNRVVERSLSALLDAVNDFDFYGGFAACRDLAGALVTAGPSLFAAHHFGRQVRQVARLRAQWRACPLPPPKERLAVFSDSVEHLDGVSTWCARFIERAEAAGQEVFVPHCGEPLHGCADGAQVDRLPAVTSFSAPLYERMKLYLPSLVHSIRWAWSRGITHVELATPGPMGLVGLLVAKVLQLPVTASYHTEVPALVRQLGGPAIVERAARSYLGWFYRQVERVFCFSAASRGSLLDMGLPQDRLQLVPQAVDPGQFSPRHRSPAVFQQLKVSTHDRPVILSVGRLSKEKNLPLIISAVENLQRRQDAPVLVIVGDGPERQSLEADCAARDFVRFVGAQRGQVLQGLYASADMFAFASCVDTLGLVNMEAMSSGIPILVPAGSAIAELVAQGVTAACYRLDAAGLAAAIEQLLDNPQHARELGRAGREAMISRWDSASFSEMWRSMVGGASAR